MAASTTAASAATAASAMSGSTTAPTAATAAVLSIGARWPTRHREGKDGHEQDHPDIHRRSSASSKSIDGASTKGAAGPAKMTIRVQVIPIWDRPPHDLGRYRRTSRKAYQELSQGG